MAVRTQIDTSPCTETWVTTWQAGTHPGWQCRPYLFNWNPHRSLRKKPPPPIGGSMGKGGRLVVTIGPCIYACSISMSSLRSAFRVCGGRAAEGTFRFGSLLSAYGSGRLAADRRGASQDAADRARRWDARLWFARQRVPSLRDHYGRGKRKHTQSRRRLVRSAIEEKKPAMWRSVR